MNLTIKSYTEGLLTRSFIEHSVRELCPVDHGGDAATIAEWASNGWFNFQLANMKFVVVDDFLVLGMCAMNYDGVVVTNYVAPEARGYGVSSKMMAYMEWSARDVYRLRCTRLVSTMTARHFYRKRGYAEWTEPERGVGNSWNFPMVKVFE